MKRTQNRPLVTGELCDREALVFARVIGVASIVWLGVLANWLAAALSLVAILLYVSSTRCGSSAAPRRTSCGEASPAACPC